MTTPTPVYPQIVRMDACNIDSTYTPGARIQIIGDTFGVKIVSINISSTDTVDRNVSIWIARFTGSFQYFLYSTVLVPANAGNIISVPSVDLLNSPQMASLPYDNNGNKYFLLGTAVDSITNFLLASCSTTPTSGKEIDIIAQSGGFD